MPYRGWQAPEPPPPPPGVSWEEWQKLSPGMRREIARQKEKGEDALWPRTVSPSRETLRAEFLKGVQATQRRLSPEELEGRSWREPELIFRGPGGEEEDEAEDAFDPNEPRDPAGKWTEGGGGGGGEGGAQPEPSALATAINPWADKVKEHAAKVAKDLKFDPDQIEVKPGIKMFSLAGKDYLTAGEAWPDGRVTLYPWSIMSEDSAQGTTAHEVMHSKFFRYMNDYLAESRDMTAELREGLMTGRFRDQRLYEPMKPDGTLQEPLASKYPIYQAYTKLFNKYPITERFSKSDGVTDYSRQWWADWKDGKATTQQALHETLAEMAKVKYLTGELPGKREWKQLYGLIEDNWKAIERRRKRQARQERVWQSSAPPSTAAPPA